MKKAGPEYYVLWAVPPGESVAFEVSREVDAPLQPECPGSPFCPGERTRRLVGAADPENPARRASVITYDFNADFEFDPGACPYGFEDKEACYRAINRKALREGCIPASERIRIGNFLKALGYRVFSEKLRKRDLDGERILMAHGPIYNFHELRCENGPGGLVLYLIRNPQEDERPERCQEI
jgi:hypothetical protein